MSDPKTVFDGSVKELSLDNFPSNIKPFTATDWDDALDQLERALVDEGKQSVTFFLGESAPYEELDEIRKSFFKNVHRNAPFNNNYKARQEDLSASSSSDLIKYLSPDAKDCFDAIAKKVSSLTVTQRYQMRTPGETSIPHFDFPFPDVPGTYKKDLPNRADCFVKGRNLRLIFCEAGGGPILFGPSKNELINGNFVTGEVENKCDLGQAWQAKGRTLTAITGQQDWGAQAIPHASPTNQLSPKNFRALTVYDISY